MIRPDEQIVAAGEVHDAQERGAGNAAGQAADGAGGQIDHHRIAKALAHERDSAIVGRDVGALAEVGDDLHVPRQLIDWAPRLALSAGGHRKRGEERRDCQRPGAG